MQILFYLKMKKKNLIFDIGRGIFDISTSKIKNNEYYVLSSCGESHLGGEDFNQRLEEYVIQEIKKMQEFKDIDYNNKNNSKILKMLKRLRIEVENVKLELTSSIFFFRFIL
jgi:molecular chaperone DnaK (HSP70)